MLSSVRRLTGHRVRQIPLLRVSDGIPKRRRPSHPNVRCPMKNTSYSIECRIMPKAASLLLSDGPRTTRWQFLRRASTLIGHSPRRPRLSKDLCYCRLKGSDRNSGQVAKWIQRSVVTHDPGNTIRCNSECRRISINFRECLLTRWGTIKGITFHLG